MLECKNIVSGYGPLTVLKGVNIKVSDNQLVTIIGANGAGKSTLLNTICGLINIKAGEIIFDGVNINSVPADKRVALGIVQSPEGRRIFPELTVEENLELGAYLNSDRKKIKDDLSYQYNLFPILGERRKQKGGSLSGGEQQMLAISRALMSRPKLLLLDEPSLGLAPKLIDKIFEKLLQIKKQGTTFLLVEQNAHLALSLADWAYVMVTGRITLEGDGKTLLENEEVKKHYLGEI